MGGRIGRLVATQSMLAAGCQRSAVSQIRLHED